MGERLRPQHRLVTPGWLYRDEARCCEGIQWVYAASLARALSARQGRPMSTSRQLSSREARSRSRRRRWCTLVNSTRRFIAAKVEGDDLWVVHGSRPLGRRARTALLPPAKRRATARAARSAFVGRKTRMEATRARVAGCATCTVNAVRIGIGEAPAARPGRLVRACLTFIAARNGGSVLSSEGAWRGPQSACGR